MTATVERKPADTIFNVPNQLTAARLLLSIALFFLVPLHWYWTALVVFVVAASTDWVDGYWARKYGQVTKLGRIFDPFVDKIIICGAFILLAVEMSATSPLLPWYARLTGWMAVVVVGREMLVTTLRSIIETAGGDFSANLAGKLKMVFQCIAVGAALVALSYGNRSLPLWLFWTLVAAIWLAVISTIYSGVGYIFAAARQMRD